MLGLSLRTADVRSALKALLQEKQFTSVNREGSMTDLVGSTTIEIINASFIADEDAIFGEVNWDYVRREEEWYNSMSLSVNDIPDGPPQIWKAVADKDGFINSNYGWCVYSTQNGFESLPHDADNELNSQYLSALKELKKNPESRRAIMIYTRPSMWLDYNKNGRSDFMCTNAVQYLLRNGKLHAVVQMRSNDAVFGYKNDRAWQQHVLEKLAGDLGVPAGDLYWNVGSLHVYARHYHLVDPVNYPKA
jgi:thymidylate synthase